MQTTADYNMQIGTHPKELLSKIDYVSPGSILLRLFKFEHLSETKGGLLNPDNEAYQTEGGKYSTKLNEAQYQFRGIVVAVSEETTVKPGDIVWISPRVISKERAFYIDREERVSIDMGYFFAYPGEIQAIEKSNNE